MKTFEDFMQECPLIAILRGITPDEVESVCESLYAGGIRVLEVPLNTPDAFNCLKKLCACAGEKMIAGAGTVLTEADVEMAYEASCRFIVSPNTEDCVIRRTKELGMVSIPGFFTATEGFKAIAAGADYLKLFPAGTMGPSYVKDLKAVIKKPICAVGGVGFENLASFKKVCAGAGIGGALYKPGKDPAQILEDSRKMVDLWNKSDS